MLSKYVSHTAEIRRFARRRQGVLEAFAWVVAMILGALAVRPLQSFIQDKIQDAFGGLQTVVVTIGGAMIGATAILASFVLFAMQVNVERLPHGLFRRFSSDSRLLAAFGAAFAFAMAGTALSLIQNPAFAALMIVLGIGSVAVVLRLLFGAFRRSLILVNPIEQIRLVRESVERQMKVFERRLSWVTPLLQQGQESSDQEEQQIDAARATVLQANKGWDQAIRRAVDHSVAYARRAGEEGDVEVSAAGLSTVVSLNRVYVRVKGRTFHANVPFFDNPSATDGFVNGTLEEIRRLREVVLARKDEQQAEQIFRTYLALVET